MPTRRRGSIVVLLAVVLVVLAGFVSLAVDVGYLRVAKAQLQVASDSASMAGARVLDGTDAGIIAARAVAVSTAAYNPVLGQALTLDQNASNDTDGDVVTGTWDTDTRSFTPSVDATEVNAVRINARREDIAAGFSSMAFGRESLAAGAQSTTHAGVPLGAGSVPWYLPFGLPSCIWDTYSNDTIDDMTFVFSPAGVDNTGWGSIDGNPSASWVDDQLDSILPCITEYASTGAVTDDCSSISVEDSVTLGNGMEAAALANVASAVDNGVTYDADAFGPLPAQKGCSKIKNYGKMIAGPIPVFQAPASYCVSGGAWNQTLPIAGFVWAAVYDVCSQGAASSKNIYLKVDLDYQYDVGTSYGGTNYGVTEDGPVVVVQ